MENKTTLEIIIDNAEFAKGFNYFITVQLDGYDEKRRTSVSEVSKSPTFTENKFYLPLKDYDLMINQRIIFVAYVVIDRPDNSDKNGIGEAKQLGESILDLGPLTPNLNNINKTGVQQRIELVRRQGDANAVVGRLNITLKLLEEAIAPEDSLNEAVNDSAHLLPEMDLLSSFVWRLRVDVRSAVNLPFNRTTESRLPSPYVEIGWTMFPMQDINIAEAVRCSAVNANRYPIWNQQLLFYPATNVTTVDGFITILLKDRFQLKPIQKATFALNYLRPYHPVHLDFLLEHAEEDGSRSHVYMSLTLEDTPIYKYSESLVNIIISDVNFDPLPKCTNRCSIMMTTDKLKHQEIPYKQIELKSESHLNNVLMSHKQDPYTTFISHSLKIPPAKLQNQYGAIASFIVPRSYLDKNLAFFLLVKDLKVLSNNTMPNSIAGYIETLDDLIKSSYYSKTHDKVPFKTTWSTDVVIYSSIASSRCAIEISVRPVEEAESDERVLNQREGNNIEDFDYKKIKEKMITNTLENYNVKLSNVPDKEKWDILSKELTQKQELIHRMMREVDDKSESLKLTGTEIVEYRKQIKLLQNENQILRRRLGQEEQMQVESLVTQEIHKMSLPELKSKIIKIAQAYRSERIRNEEFEKAIKQAQVEISNSRKLALELEQLQTTHEEESKKFLDMQKETQKIGLYRETVKKQEEVIGKLEKLLNKTINESSRQKESLVELEQLRTENLKLQNELKNLILNSSSAVFGGINTINGTKNINPEKYKKEISILENHIRELKEQLSNKRPITNDRKQIQSDIVELEVKLHISQTRIRSLEDELQDSTRKNAQEISRLKIILAEKEALIENMRIENSI